MPRCQSLPFLVINFTESCWITADFRQNSAHWQRSPSVLTESETSRRIYHRTPAWFSVMRLSLNESQTLNVSGSYLIRLQYYLSIKISNTYLRSNEDLQSIVQCWIPPETLSIHLSHHHCSIYVTGGGAYPCCHPGRGAYSLNRSLLQHNCYVETNNSPVTHKFQSDLNDALILWTFVFHAVHDSDVGGESLRWWLLTALTKFIGKQKVC